MVDCELNWTHTVLSSLCSFFRWQPIHQSCKWVSTYTKHWCPAKFVMGYFLSLWPCPFAYSFSYPKDACSTLPYVCAGPHFGNFIWIDPLYSLFSVSLSHKNFTFRVRPVILYQISYSCWLRPSSYGYSRLDLSTIPDHTLNSHFLIGLDRNYFQLTVEDWNRMNHRQWENWKKSREAGWSQRTGRGKPWVTLYSNRASWYSRSHQYEYKKFTGDMG